MLRRKNDGGGIAVQSVVLPANIIRVGDPGPPGAADVATAEDTAAGALLSLAPGSPEPQAAPASPEPQAAPASPSHDSPWFVADTTTAMRVWDKVDGKVISELQEGDSIRVFLPLSPCEKTSLHWARVHAFHDKLGAVAVGWAVVAQDDDRGHRLCNLRL